MEVDGAAVRDHAESLERAKENLRHERAKAAAQVQQRVARATQDHRQRQPVPQQQYPQQNQYRGSAGGPTLPQQILAEMRQVAHADPMSNTPSSRPAASSSESDIQRSHRSGHSAAPVGQTTGFVDVSRSTRHPTGAEATSTFTNIDRFSEGDSTSTSHRGGARRM